MNRNARARKDNETEKIIDTKKRERS